MFFGKKRKPKKVRITAECQHCGWRKSWTCNDVPVATDAAEIMAEEAAMKHATKKEGHRVVVYWTEA